MAMWSVKTFSSFQGKKQMTFPTSFKLTVPPLKVNAHQARLIPRDYTAESHETSVLFGSLWRFILIFKINSVKVFLRKSQRSQRELQVFLLLWACFRLRAKRTRTWWPANLSLESQHLCNKFVVRWKKRYNGCKPRQSVIQSKKPVPETKTVFLRY